MSYGNWKHILGIFKLLKLSFHETHDWDPLVLSSHFPSLSHRSLSSFLFFYLLFFFLPHLSFFFSLLSLFFAALHSVLYFFIFCFLFLHHIIFLMLYFLFYGSFSKSKQFPQVEQPNQREKEREREREPWPGKEQTFQASRSTLFLKPSFFFIFFLFICSILYFFFELKVPSSVIVYGFGDLVDLGFRIWQMEFGFGFGVSKYKHEWVLGLLV